MDSHRFKEMMKEAFLEDYQKLLEVGFDEKKFANQLGMFRVKSHLEKLLFDKYQQSLAPTLRTLEELCKKTESELSQVKKELNQHDIEVSILIIITHILATQEQSNFICEIIC